MVFTVKVTHTSKGWGCGGSFRNESHFSHLQPLHASKSKLRVITIPTFIMYDIQLLSKFLEISQPLALAQNAIFSVFYYQDDILMDYQLQRLPSWYNYQSTLHSVLTHTENAVENKRLL
jgi:hypothetical protein